MVLLNLFYQNVTVKYKSTVCSKATLLILVSVVIVLLAPLFIAYRSRGFWLKSYTFYEQPDVHYKYQYFFLAEAENDQFISCGNLPRAGNLELTQKCHIVKVREEDYNGDNKIDEIHFQIEALNPQRLKFYATTLILVLDYKIHTTCPLQMEGLVILTDTFGIQLSKHFTSTTLKLSQSLPLPCWKNYKDTRYNSSVISEINPEETYNWIKDLIYDYSRRNVSTVTENTFKRTVYGVSNSIEVSLSLAIPENKLRYKPGVSQELKHLWQQYLSIAVIFYWIMYKINSYVFTHRLIPTWERTPWKKFT